jgi:hypothetical protein
MPPIAAPTQSRKRESAIELMTQAIATKAPEPQTMTFGPNLSIR